MSIGLRFKLRNSVFIHYTVSCLYTTYCGLLYNLLAQAFLWTLHFTGLTNHLTMALFPLSRSINEMKRLEEMSNMFQSSGVQHHPPEPKAQTEGNEDSEGKEQPWEMVMDKKHFKLWRRPITGTHLYQYRGEPSLAIFWVP